MRSIEHQSAVVLSDKEIEGTRGYPGLVFRTREAQRVLDGSSTTRKDADFNVVPERPASEALSQFALNSMSSIVAVIDDEGTIVATNQSWKRFAEENGLKTDPGMVGRNYLDAIDSDQSDVAAEAKTGLEQLLKGDREEFSLEYPCHSPEKKRWFEMDAIPGEFRNSRHITITHTRITERKLIQNNLVEQEARYRSLFEDSPIALWEEDFSGVVQVFRTIKDLGVQDFEQYFEEHPEVVSRCAEALSIVNANQHALKLYGVETQEEFAKRMDAPLHPTRRKNLQDHLLGLIRGETYLSNELETIDTDGNTIYIQANLAVAPGFEDTLGKVFISALDITERKQAQKELRQSLEEKRTLLKETHHRVKNNLQVVLSLIQLQMTNVEDPGTQARLQTIQGRIHSMAQIHEQLYQTEDLANVPLNDYIEKLGQSILRSSMKQKENVDITVNVDCTALNIESMVPFGLVLNELITNAIEHGFREGDGGLLLIEGGEQSSGELEIVIQDDGVGWDTEDALEGSGSLGLTLVRTLIEKQLNGSFSIEQANGTRILLTFPLNSSNPA